MHSHVLMFLGHLDSPSTLKPLNAFKIQYPIKTLIKN